MKPVMMIALGTGFLALVVPQITPESEIRQETNVIRQKEKPSTFGSAKLSKRDAKRQARCHRDSDLGINPCASRRVRKNKSVKVASSRNKNTGGRSVIIARNSSGQYNTTARMNGRRVRVLVDTGASSVAINRSTARRLGINVSDSDFIHKASTANGTALFARAKIDSIRIGGIVMDNVDTAILSDNALSGTLLGMAFLDRLSKVQVENGELKLTQ